ACGQVAAPPTGANSLLQEGRELEAQHRWPEAVSHYEQALRDFPEHPQLKLHKTLAQIHVDLDRRLDDVSFVKMVAGLNESQALSMYHEIGWKLHSHYVETPDWQQLTWRGTANLDVALTKSGYVSRMLPGVSPEAVTAFRNELRSDVNKRAVRNRTEAQNLVSYTSRLAQQRLGLSPAAVILEYCSGAVSALDQYSAYLTSDQLDDVYNQIEGTFVGLGVELKAEENALRIVNVIPGGPADKAGIQADDLIIAVDNQSTEVISTERAADMLKGEQGSTVMVRVATAGQAPRDLQIRRDHVDVPCVEDVKIVDVHSGTAYFRLTSFQKPTSRDVDEALWKLHRQGMKSLIIDLRGNPGGLLLASVEVADKFLTDGRIVSTRGRSERENFNYEAHSVGTWNVPLVVLIDRDTASASEIFAGAIRDQARGKVVGERSYGKGSVQGIFPLNIAGAGVRLTTAKFFSPSGKAISNQGVEPHLAINADNPYHGHGSIADPTTDPVLHAAIGAAQNLTVAHR
ncbi:MAG: S41 family peptidase, partial [Planctomycetales bacterium]|nr:S41 family peptidase [Planctomycetales bacterium]